MSNGEKIIKKSFQEACKNDTNWAGTLTPHRSTKVILLFGCLVHPILNNTAGLEIILSYPSDIWPIVCHFSSDIHSSGGVLPRPHILPTDLRIGESMKCSTKSWYCWIGSGFHFPNTSFWPMTSSQRMLSDHKRRGGSKKIVKISKLSDYLEIRYRY